jgi:hypothetical protein
MANPFTYGSVTGKGAMSSGPSDRFGQMARKLAGGTANPGYHTAVNPAVKPMGPAVAMPSQMKPSQPTGMTPASPAMPSGVGPVSPSGMSNVPGMGQSVADQEAQLSEFLNNAYMQRQAGGSPSPMTVSGPSPSAVGPEAQPPVVDFLSSLVAVLRGGK